MCKKKSIYYYISKIIIFKETFTRLNSSYRLNSSRRYNKSQISKCKAKENKWILDVIKHNEKFRSFITMKKKKFEKIARIIEELTNIKGVKNKIIEYAENHNRIRKLINKKMDQIKCDHDKSIA